VKGGKIGSVSTAGVLFGRTADGMRFCFLSGVLSEQFLHRFIAAKHRSMWVPRLYIQPPQPIG
jgi:hypothetical protein